MSELHAPKPEEATPEGDLRAAPDSASAEGPLLRPGDTCWRVERAQRIAFLVDGDAFFRAVRGALHRARHSVLIVGWDIDPRMRLTPDDPETLGQMLARLTAERPALRIHALRWNMPFPIMLEHPHGPFERLDRETGPRLALRLDDELPIGAAQHQKLVVVDDALAFCGGIDLAGDRWDTPEHRDHDPRRRWPTGDPYAPRHDVMMAVDGPAARAVGDLARDRWLRATGEILPPAPPGADPWPEEAVPDLHAPGAGVRVGIARTLPGKPDAADPLDQPVRESEALYFAAIEAARKVIYVENQYFASARIAEALARRLAEPDGPEVVVVLSQESPSWFDRMAMDTPRAVVLRQLQDCNHHGRLRTLTPLTEEGASVIVHSKVMVVDDWFLRIGSSNLNNRSMGYDTECDLGLEADAGDERARAAIPAFRDRLLAEHMGVEPEALARAIAEEGSLVAALDRLAKPSGRRLAPLPEADPSLTEQAFAALRIADPDRPEEAWAVWKRVQLDRKPDPSLVRAAGAALLTTGIVAGAFMLARLLAAPVPPRKPRRSVRADAVDTGDGESKPRVRVRARAGTRVGAGE
ncbi:phospholipase D-like domain-containing protein [Azospirillum sp. SYSU D00513]|uniref:phospholipase D-like domain-containing protein n=1 Tax=Azospirillum sp. SYSU D00513 TaxID=2812561 RepID=UPI001A95B575|nr:phospholipase D-like domain-containing protein [Azospirillum sp. SYSU D00513]